MFMHKQPNSSELLPPWIVCIWKLRHTLETLKRRKKIIWIKYEICKWKTKGFFLNEHLDVYAEEQLKLLKPWFCKSVRHTLKTLKRRKNNMNEIIICKQKKKIFFSNEDLDAYEAKQANTTSSLFTVETVKPLMMVVENSKKIYIDTRA